MTQTSGSPEDRDNPLIGSIVELLRDQRGSDFAAYRPGTLGRRIVLASHAAGCATLAEYVERLRTDSSEPDRLLARITIKASGLFRDALFFRALEQLLVERVAREPAPVRCWSAGCAQGEEAYSLAVLLLDATKSACTTPVMATDLDPRALQMARIGCYESHVVQNVPPDRLAAHFEAMKRGSVLAYHVRERVREAVQFVQHDLASSETPHGGPFDVVLCRNVLIYWSRPVQERMTGLLVRSLAPRGLLCLGPAEWLPRSLSDQFDVVHARHRIYRLRAA